jgi:hypothetical protein
MLLLILIIKSVFIILRGRRRWLWGFGLWFRCPLLNLHATQQTSETEGDHWSSQHHFKISHPSWLGRMPRFIVQQCQKSLGSFTMAGNFAD